MTAELTRTVVADPRRGGAARASVGAAKGRAGAKRPAGGRHTGVSETDPSRGLRGAARVMDALLTPVEATGLRVLRVVLDAGSLGDHARVPATEQHFVYVLEGGVVLSVDGVDRALVPHQSLTFRTPCSYGWRNPTRAPAILLWVTVGPQR